jgi:hypothetical protein
VGGPRYPLGSGGVPNPGYATSLRYVSRRVRLPSLVRLVDIALTCYFSGRADRIWTCDHLTPRLNRDVRRGAWMTGLRS